MELCNGERCLHKDTLIVVCYALFCICFGLTVAFVVVFLDKRRERKAKASCGAEAMEVSSLYPFRKTQNVYIKFPYSLLMDAIRSPDSSLSSMRCTGPRAKQATSPLAVEQI